MPKNIWALSITEKRTTSYEIEQYIFKILKNNSIGTTKELIQLVKQEYTLSEKKIISVIICLEKQNRIHFKPQFNLKKSFKNYLFSSNALWFWLIITSILATALAFALISDESYLLFHIRMIIRSIFIIIIPGFAFMKMLNLHKVKLANSNVFTNLLSILFIIVMSIIIVAIDGLILNYSPWGVGLVSITISLYFLTIIFGFVGVFREYYENVKNFGE